MNPPLSTIRIPKERMGKLAISRLISRIENILPERITLRIAANLIIRDSVKKI